MDKKKKIIIGSIVAIVLVIAIIGVSMSGKKDTSGEQGNETNVTDQSNNEQSSEDDKPENQKEPEPAKGSNFSELEEKIKELEYTYFEEGCYDLFEDNESIVFIEILENNVIMTLKDKSKIDNEKIIEVIKMLIPNEYESIIDHVKNKNEEIAMSLDNRTVSIILNGEEVKISFTK